MFIHLVSCFYKEENMAFWVESEMSEVSTEKSVPFVSSSKAASEILPCSTFISIQEESFVEQVYADVCVFAVNPQSSGEAMGTIVV